MTTDSMVHGVLYVPLAQRRACQIARCDHWKPKTWPGRQFWFVIHYCGHDHHIMRLFEGPSQLSFWLRRNARWRGALVQSTGKIRWK